MDNRSLDARKFAEAARAYAERVSAPRATARATLACLGTHDRDGNLAPEYE